MLEVSSGEEDVVLHHLVHFIVNMVIEILLPGHFQGVVAVLHLHCDIFPAIGIHIVVDFAAPLLQHRCEVGAPPHVTRSECEEDLEADDQNTIIQSGFF